MIIHASMSIEFLSQPVKA